MDLGAARAGKTEQSQQRTSRYHGSGRQGKAMQYRSPAEIDFLIPAAQNLAYKYGIKKGEARPVEHFRPRRGTTYKGREQEPGVSPSTVPKPLISNQSPLTKRLSHSHSHLVNFDIPGTGFHFHCGAAAADLAAEVVMALDGALHHHLSIRMDTSGTGRCVQVESCLVRPQFNAA